MTANPALALPADPASDGPRERLAALFDAHEDRLYRLARRLTGSADEARDLVQETSSTSAATSGAGHRCEHGMPRCSVPARRSTPPRSSRPNIAHAELIAGGTATTFAVALTFNDAGASRIAIATSGHVGRPLAILIDGEVVMAPVLRSPITTSALITGNFTRAGAERIVAGIVGR